MSHRLMARRTLVERTLSFITALALLASQLTIPPGVEASPLGSSTASAGTVPPPAATLIENFQPDLFTGRATTSIPIAVPPGRKGMQPGLALAYSSSSRNGWVGVGWSFDLGYIERSTKNGVPKYDSTDTFTFMFQGVTSDLAQIPDGTYRAKDEGLFLRFESKGVSGWEVRDKSGTRYLFGQTATSQIEETGKVYRWCLDKVIDTNGNFLSISYTKDQKQSYLSQIRYTGYEPTALAPSNQVDFFLEDRPDVETSYRSGFGVTTAKRLKSIETKATVGGVLSLARRYELSYTQSQRTGRSLLNSVRQVGADGLMSLPPMTLGYTEELPRYLLCANCNPTITSGNHGWQLQWHIGSLFPSNFSANDQRLWPSGFFEPGVVCHQEKICRRRIFWTHCEEVTVCGAIPQVGWNGMELVDGGKSGGRDGLSWSIATNGNLDVSGPADTHLLARTWVYTTAARTLSLASLGVSGRADVFYAALGASQWSVASGNQVSLGAGWTAVAVTAYNEFGGFTLDLNTDVLSQLGVGGAMNNTQFAPMRLVGDFNGDALSDILALNAAVSPTEWRVTPNSPNGFQQDQLWMTGIADNQHTPIVGDFDGNGKTDVAAVDTLWDKGRWHFGRSTGQAFTAWGFPSLTFAPDSIPFVGDFDGDSKTDLGGFTKATSAWRVLLDPAERRIDQQWLSASTEIPLAGDFNGDGLADVAGYDKAGGSVWVALSTGTSFRSPVTWLSGSSASANWSPITADLNGDGLTDLANYEKSSGSVFYVPSTGVAFGSVLTLISGIFNLRSTDDALQVGDWSGDGIADPGVMNMVTGQAELAVSMGQPPDLLNRIDNGVGGTTQLTYTPSSALDNAAGDGIPALPFVIPVVTQAAVSDGMGNSYATTYHYTGGYYDIWTREFRGFAKIEVRDPEGTVSITEFHQGEQTKGRPIRTQAQDAEGHLWTKQEYTWLSPTLYTDAAGNPIVRFVNLYQLDSFIYDGDATFRQTQSQFLYDGFGNLRKTIEQGDVSVTGDERSTVTEFVYNQTDWVVNKPARVKVLSLDGLVKYSQRTFYYDANTSYPSTDAATGGLVPQISLTKGNLTKEEEWLNTAPSPVTTLTYDSYGNVSTVTDALGRKTTNAYDATGTYLTKITNALNHTRQFTYDSRFGQVTSTTDQNGVKTKSLHDALGRVIQASFIDPTTNAEAVTSKVEYDLSTIPSRTTATAYAKSGLAEPLTTYQFSDGLGRAIQTRVPAEDPTKQIITGAVEFNSRGLVAKQWVPYLSNISSSYVPFSVELSASSLAAVTYSYDPMGRLATTTNPDGTVTLYDYNDGEASVSVAGKTQTQQLSDAYGRLVKVEEVLSETEMYTTTYEYDPLGNLTKVTGSRGNVTTIRYDSLGRKLSMTDPDMGTWSYTYDTVDNLKTQTDARGVKTSFSYDSLNRLKTKSYTIPTGSGIPSPGTVTYAYDNTLKPYSKGRLTKVTDGSGTTNFEYDHLGRLIKESKTLDGTTHVIQRTYDLLGRLTSLKYPDNEIVNYTFNGQGGIERIASSSKTYVTNVDYNAAGQLVKLTYGNGVTTDYSYDPQTLRLSSLITRNSSLAALQDFNYTFDPLGNVTQIIDRVNTGTQNFGYDALNRLTLAQGSYGTFTYAYDPIGNMTSKEGISQFYGLVDGTKPHAVTSTSDGKTFSYDASGNRVAQTDLSGTTSYTFDAESRLNKVTKPDGTITSFVYDGDGGRIKQVTPAGTTRYLGEVYELLPDGTKTKYIFAGSLRIAAKDSTGALRFYHGDHLGSSNVITDAAGQVIELAEFSPYGSHSRREGPANVTHKFTGQRLDSSTGLYFYGARYYDPVTARFTQPDPFIQDPADPQMLNRYAYARNNPVKYVDPSGNFVFLAFLGLLALGAVVGAVVSIGIGLATGQIHSWKDVGRFAAVGAASGALLVGGGYLLGPAGLALAGTAKALGDFALLLAAGTLAGGLDSSLQGGSFGEGAANGAFTTIVTFGLFKGSGAVLGELANTRLGQAVKGAVSAGGARLSQVFRELLDRSGLGAIQTQVDFVATSEGLIKNVAAKDTSVFTTSAPLGVVRFALNPFRTGLRALGQQGGFYATTVQEAEQLGGFTVGSFRILLGPQVQRAADRLALSQMHPIVRGTILFGRYIGIPIGTKVQVGIVQRIRDAFGKILSGGAPEFRFPID